MGLAGLARGESSYETEIAAWRRDVERKLTADDGWLAVAGLFWLKRGLSRFGSDRANEIVLPQPAPARAGSFEFDGSRVTLQAQAGVTLRVRGTAVTSRPLASDKNGEADIVELGDLSLFVIERGARVGIRLRDKNSRLRREFTGRTWFPVQARYRVTGKFVAHTAETRIAVPNILGDTERQVSPGYVLFQLEGREHRLDAVIDDKQLFFIFRDRTAGQKTYAAGRFLKSDFAKNGQVVLDFNKAYNPPCAFTPFATCPLPPRQNHLPIAIEAGELNYHHA